MNIPLITCHYCGNLIHRHDVAHAHQVDKDTIHYYHAACYQEHQREKEAEDEAAILYNGGYP